MFRTAFSVKRLRRRAVESSCALCPLTRQRGAFAAGARDVRRNSRIRIAADVPIEVSDFKTQTVPLFKVNQRAEAGFVTSIGFLLRSISLVVVLHPNGEIVLTRFVTISVPRSVTVLVSYAELNAVMRLLLRRYDRIQRQAED